MIVPTELTVLVGLPPLEWSSQATISLQVSSTLLSALLSHAEFCRPSRVTKACIQMVTSEVRDYTYREDYVEWLLATHKVLRSTQKQPPCRDCHAEFVMYD